MLVDANKHANYPSQSPLFYPVEGSQCIVSPLQRISSWCIKQDIYENKIQWSTQLLRYVQRDTTQLE
jgi:hypothetical protein